MPSVYGPLLSKRMFDNRPQIGNIRAECAFDDVSQRLALSLLLRQDGSMGVLVPEPVQRGAVQVPERLGGQGVDLLLGPN